MKKIWYVIISVCFLALSDIYAQQDPQYSMYMFNGLYLNPAYAGSKEVIDITAIYRYQWAGFGDGAPQSGLVAFHTPFRKNQYAVGVVTGYDHIGYTDMYNLLGMFSYRISINNRSKLALGIQAGFYHFNDNRNNAVLVDQGDAVFSDQRSLYIPNAGAGLYLYGKRYYIGFSIPHILNMNLSERLQHAANSDNLTRQYRHLFFTAGGILGSETAFVKFKPSFLMKYVQGLDKKIPDFDLNFSILLDDRYWLGTSLRTGGDQRGPYFESVVGMFEFMATQQLRIGYSYDYTLSDIQEFVHGTHEVFIGYHFGFKKQKFVNVRYGTYF